MEGGAKAEKAKMALNLAEAIYRLYLREEYNRLVQALVDALQDPAPQVRSVSARALGDFKKDKFAEPLIALLKREKDNEVRRETLVALESLGAKTAHFSNSISIAEVRTEKLSEEQRQRFTQALLQLTRKDLPDSLAARTNEWLEVIAGEKTVTAHNLILQANLDEAERLLRDALALVPNSKNANYKLGRFYYDNGEPQKGLAILDSLGFVAHINPLKTAPKIDGQLDEAA